MARRTAWPFTRALRGHAKSQPRAPWRLPAKPNASPSSREPWRTFLHYDSDTRVLSSRPIKGTIARAGADAAEASNLRADPKERAEHTMIVDLVRNDLGRLADVRIGACRGPDGRRALREVGASCLPPSHAAYLVTAASKTSFDATFPPGSVDRHSKKFEPSRSSRPSNPIHAACIAGPSDTSARNGGPLILR